MLVLISKKEKVWWIVLDKFSIFIDRYPSSSSLLRLVENLDYMQKKRHIYGKKTREERILQ